jgi:hypothetical protein
MWKSLFYLSNLLRIVSHILKKFNKNLMKKEWKKEYRSEEGEWSGGERWQNSLLKIYENIRVELTVVLEMTV